jgi:tetraacyldisaccharide 4'-kinase
LPAGPYREPLASLARATAVVVTRKSASQGDVDAALAAVARAARDVPAAVARLSLDALHVWCGGAADRASTEALDGERVLAVAAVGEPRAFFAQLRALGAVVDEAPFPDHHAFDAADVDALARRAETADRVVCTLKDAVKLGPRWPRLGPPLWYVSQRVTIERGADVLHSLVARLLHARANRTDTAGHGRPF